MRTWLLKFRLSSAVDAGKPIPEALRKKAVASPEAARFLATTLALGDTLKRRPATSEIPATLHWAIMRSVRAESQPTAPKPRWGVGAWLAAAGAAASLALLLAAPWHKTPTLALRNQPVPPPAPATLSAPTVSEFMAQTVTRSVVSPLAEEFDRLGQDLDRTERFLLASLP